MSRGAAEIAEHERAGRRFRAAGVSSFVREEGEGDAVVLMHGVPASSYLYRKVLPALAARGLRGVAFDLPGTGLADRPEDFDYRWSGLGRWTHAALDALGLDRFHLVVHDIGGPVGFEVAAAAPERVRSLTLLNTMVEVDVFKRPWPMEPLARRGIGEAYLAGMTPWALRLFMLRFGVLDRTAVSLDEWAAWVALTKRGDGGRSLLRIMRGFERTREARDRYARALRDVPYPVQVVWGAQDPALRLDHHGRLAMLATGVDRVHTLPARHFLQEDQPQAVAEHIAALAERAA